MQVHVGDPNLDVLAVPETNGPTMSLLSMEQLPADGGSGPMEVPGGRVRQQAGTKGDPTEADSTKVWPRDHHSSRNQRLPVSSDLPHLPEGVGEEEQEQRCSQQRQFSGQLQRRDPQRGEDAATIQAVHGVAKDAPSKVVRQVKNALKKAISFWRSIQQVLSFHETDEGTVSGKLKQLNDEILDDLIRNPKGSKRTQAVAEAMHLELRSLKTIAEVYNPGCFGRLSQKTWT